MIDAKKARRLALAGLVAPAFLFAAPATAFADSGYENTECTTSEHAGSDGAGSYQECEHTSSYTDGSSGYDNGYNNGDYRNDGVLTGVLRGLGL